MSGYTKDTVTDARNTASDATGGAVSPTLLHESVNLISHSIDFAKGVVGLGGATPASSPSDVIHGTHGVQYSQSVGGLISEARDLAAHAIQSTRDVTKYYVAAGADEVQHKANQAGGKTQDAVNKAQDVASDVQQSVQQARPIGYVGSVRNLVAAVVDKPLEIAQNIIASGAQKVDEMTPGSSGGSPTDKLASSAPNTADYAKNKAQNGANQSQSALANAAGTIYSKGAVAVDQLDQQTRGAQNLAVNAAKTALGGAARQADIMTSKVSK